MIVILQLCRPFPHIANDILRQDDRHLDDLLHAQPLLRGLHPRPETHLEEHSLDEPGLNAGQGVRRPLEEEDGVAGGWGKPACLGLALPSCLLGGGAPPLLCSVLN